MRLVGVLHDEVQAKRFSHLLTEESIENQCEMESNTDWGSPDYGTHTFKIWIKEEDQLKTALDWFERFQKDPNDPSFQVKRIRPVVLPAEDELQEKIRQGSMRFIRVGRATLATNVTPLGLVTYYLLILCTVLFFTSGITSPNIEKIPAAISWAPLYISPINRLLMFDYPEAYEYIMKIVTVYGVDSLQTLNELPAEGKQLLQQFAKTPYWTGLYDKILEAHAHPDLVFSLGAPLFEKISQGQIWRLATPILLHGGLLHLLFNMMWLYILGKQIEQRLNTFRYILFILITGILSNIAQYLMSGANFIGFSGVLVGMFSFIWVRLKIAPWEGYQMQPSTIKFIALFIFGMAGIQAVSFLFEMFYETSISPGIANTAHLAGGVVGLVLGRLKFFSWKT